MLEGKDIPSGFVSLGFLVFVGVILFMDIVHSFVFPWYSLAPSENTTGLEDRSSAG